MTRRPQGLFRLTAAALLAFSCVTAGALVLPDAADAQTRRGRHTATAKKPAHKSPRPVAVKKPSAAFPADSALGAKIADWLAFTNDNPSAGFGRLSAFLRANPDWPAQAKMELAAEKALPGALPDAEVIAWFRDAGPPRTADGMLRFAGALIDSGLRAEADAALNGWWPDATLDNAEQARILARCGDAIARETQISRFNKIMAKGQYTNARALAGRIGGGYPQLAEARVALAERRPGAETALARVPAELQDDAGLLYERLRARERSGNIAGALDILKKAPPSERIFNAEDWWKQRHLIARDLLRDKDYALAYDVVAPHGLTSGAGFADAEFLAGWLALRFLDRPEAARQHFETLYQGTATPLSRSRGAYWAGRASEAAGDPDGAANWYQTASLHQTTFYGQLAADKLPVDLKPAARPPVTASAVDEAAFAARELAQAARLLAAAGKDGEARLFLDALADNAKTAEDNLLAAALADDLGYKPQSLQIAKDALTAGAFIPDYLFPTVTEHMTGSRENRALAHALIRQESLFDAKALSSAGARGLMQLMPATARATARRIGVPYDARKLTDPAYNIRLGMANLAQLLDHYGYNRVADKRAAAVLTLAAYNGGMGNVAKWIAANGDPRNPGVDLLDWIEMIPFSETRNYVQRVLENEAVYKQNPDLQAALRPAPPQAVLALN